MHCDGCSTGRNSKAGQISRSSDQPAPQGRNAGRPPSRPGSSKGGQGRQAYALSPGLHTLANSLRTPVAVQAPPRRVATCRAVNSAAIACRLMPLARSSVAIGATRASNAAVCSRTASWARAMPSSGFLGLPSRRVGRQPPRRLPRALAAARASFVLVEIISRSCSATAARI